MHRDTDVIKLDPEIKPERVKAIVRKPSVSTIRGSLRAARNKPCPCGSGIKYKKCDHPLR